MNEDRVIVGLPDLPFLIPEMGGSFIDVYDLEASLHVGGQLPAPLGLLLQQRGPLHSAQHLVVGSTPTDPVAPVPEPQALLRDLRLEPFLNLEDALPQ